MKLNVDNSHLNFNELAVVAMNFGQLQRVERNDLFNYELKIESAEFVEKASTFFSMLRDELIEELKEELENDFDILEKYISLGCPTLDIMLAQHQKVIAGLIAFYDLEVLNALLGKANKEQNTIKYLAFTLDFVEVEKVVRIKGRAIRV